MKSSAATSVMVARARGYLTPFGVDLRDAVTSAFAGVGRQRLAVALFSGRAFTHVQQARPIRFAIKINQSMQMKRH